MHASKYGILTVVTFEYFPVGIHVRLFFRKFSTNFRSTAMKIKIFENDNAFLLYVKLISKFCSNDSMNFYCKKSITLVHF